MDSSVGGTYGQQESAAYNGHFGCERYRPLFIFNQNGDVERALLHNGNVASADNWRSVLEPVIARHRPGRSTSTSGAMRHSPSPSCTSCSKPRAIVTPYDSKPIPFSNATSGTR